MSTEHEQLVNALREVLRDNSPEAPLLIQRVPFICEDIRNIKKAMEPLANVPTDLMWIKRLLGGVGVTLLGGLALAIFEKII